MEADATLDSSPRLPAIRPYVLANQKVDLDVGFDGRITGTTTLTLLPQKNDFDTIILYARQCEISNVTVNGQKADIAVYHDPCDTLSLHVNASVHQHSIIAEKIQPFVSADPDPELVINLPPNLKVEKNPQFVEQTATGTRSSKITGNPQSAIDASEVLEDTAVSQYTPLEVKLDFLSIHTRDALHISAGPPGSGRWPHAYTRGSFLPGRAAALFPCLNRPSFRCTWEISLTGPRTVGDALRQAYGEHSVDPKIRDDAQLYEAREMRFICLGDIQDDFVNKTNQSKRTVTYSISQNVAAEHIGFAIGPFEEFDLSTLREADKIEKLGENATPISAYFLPGRKMEVEWTCLPTTDALDHYALQYAPFPFKSFSYCFVEDHPNEISSFAGLSVCSSRLLYPASVIDIQQEVTRSLISALTTQWLGVQIMPRAAEDTWVVVGAALFMAELFMKDLCGNNEHRFHFRTIADKVCKLDHERPSIWDMGRILHVDPAEFEFLALKAPLVLFILDNRIKKEHGSHKMGANIGKFMSRARMEDLKDNMLSTQDFCKMTEKVLHASIDDFINQWVKGAGTPTFNVSQRFNKKKLVVEMTIKQALGGDVMPNRELDPETFVRDVREDFNGVWANEPQALFTGPMTIRIHEADGTPYEHIVQIHEHNQKIEVPYNTKYKRLKRGKGAKKAKASGRADDEEQETLLYSLGDVLQDVDEVQEWKIKDWTEEEELRMGQESYEWIRVDADFEWIAQFSPFLPGPMFVSQLQQDKDVDAQLFSIQSIAKYSTSPLISSFLLRTMMDGRYFHGIRTAAAANLVQHAAKHNEVDTPVGIGWYHLRKAYETLFCAVEGDTVMPQPNDFSDQLSYRVQCAIIKAMSRIRDEAGYAPDEVTAFLLDKLKYNDNSQNEYSDAYFVSALLDSLTECLCNKPEKPTEAEEEDLNFAERNALADLRIAEDVAMDEIDRYRRMDEWTSSFQNAYSRTALRCQARLSARRLRHHTPMHFLQYARPGNYDMLRCTAYEMLAASDLFSNERILHCYIHGMTTVASPYVRERMRQAFGKALARVAIGTGVSNPAVATQASNGLTVEGAGPEPAQNPVSSDRRTSIDGALMALKQELDGNVTLKEDLYQALCHPDAGFEDIRATVEFCKMLYEPKDTEMRLTLRLPRYWRVQRLEGYKFKFFQGEKVRTKAMPVIAPKQAKIKFLSKPASTSTKPAIAPNSAQHSAGKLRLLNPSRQNSISQARSPSISVAASTPTPPPPLANKAQSPPPRPKVTLKFGSRPSLSGPGQ